MRDLLVLGAGPAGAAAAFRAARRGLDVALVERSGAPGGASGSFKVSGQRVDFGSHRLHPTTDPEILAAIQRALGGDLQKRTRKGRIRLAGRWLAFPPGPADLLANLPPAFALGAAFDAATGWARRAGADSFAEVLRAGLGPTMSRRFYFPYARKLWGLEPDEISGEQARRRVSASSARALLERVLRRPAEAPFFYYPRRGFGQIVEGFVEGAQRHGAELLLERAATRIECSSSDVRVQLSDGETLGARRVFSTVPLTLLAAMTDPAPPQEVTEAARSLELRSMVLVYLVLDVDRFTSFDAHYLPEAWTPVTRISEPKNYRDGPDPAGRTVLCAEIPCSRNDPVWEMDDETLAEVVLDALAHARLPNAPVSEVAVRRLSHAYPVYRRGYEEAFALLDRWASSLDRVLTFGRQGLFVHDNSHHAYAMAWAAVSAIRDDGEFDGDAWSRARRRFEDHVVED